MPMQKFVSVITPHNIEQKLEKDLSNEQKVLQ